MCDGPSPITAPPHQAFVPAHKGVKSNPAAEKRNPLWHSLKCCSSMRRIQKRRGIPRRNAVRKVPFGKAYGKVPSVRAAAGDHPAVQNFDPLAGGTLAKAGHKGMQEAGATRQKQRAREGKG